MLIDIPTFTEYMYTYLRNIDIQESALAIPDIYFYSDNGAEVIDALAEKLRYSRLSHRLTYDYLGNVFIKDELHEEVYCYFDGNYGVYMVDIIYFKITSVAYVNFCKDKDKLNHIIRYGVDGHEYFYNPQTKKIENMHEHRIINAIGQSLRGGN